ncbi:MAG: type III-B CRISPR module RAMP protein Cmr1 [Bryobacterales bacterium]|nr:type III-B CRISPR module RAMP protein Cmr1 [Bryobacterales bacterium]
MTTDLREYNFRTVTPLFGGGVEPRHTDPVSVIHPPAIRGHLRFWWRATSGASFQNHAALKSAEDALWGSTSRASRVAINVIIQNRGRALQTNTINHHLTLRRLFPLFDANPQLIRCNVKFQLQVRLAPDMDPGMISGVESALWAWATFGGIGSRVRRGCGALLCQEFPPGDLNGAQPDFAIRCRSFINPAAPQRKWPCLRDWPLFLLGHPLTHMESWYRILSDFHASRTAGHASVLISPRIGAGLRMASPVILKPLAINEQYAYPMILPLSVQVCCPHRPEGNDNRPAIGRLMTFFQQRGYS